MSWGKMSMGHFVLGAFCPWGKMSPNQQSVIIIAEALMALKMYFWDPHNEIKCVLSIIESYSIEEKNRSKFSHLLTGQGQGGLRLGDILSQRQNVPLHYAPPQRHNVPTYAPSPATFCPTFSI